ncbi:N-acetylglucosamine kinase [Aphelenchoides avenae]|nr:N-acetylglucosamine kinase [Aphelenchus avenae]
MHFSSEWSIEHLLILSGLRCIPIRLVDTDPHSIYIAKIMSADATNKRYVYAGVEGGATRCRLAFVDSEGTVLGDWPVDKGLNCLLEGIERTADFIAQWIRKMAQEVGVSLPLKSLGMGLSGAEDPSFNERFVAYMRLQHGDIAEDVLLTADSVIPAAVFPEGKLRRGVVIVAGTGSGCRLLKADGSVHGSGGWGHLIGDGGAAFWIVMRAVRKIYDDADGMEECPYDTQRVESALCAHFEIPDRLGLLDLLYGKDFRKAHIASFAAKLAELAPEDEFALSVLSDAGEILGRHLVAVSRHFDEEMCSDVHVLVIGSVFKSWQFLKPGFQRALEQYDKARRIRQVTFHRSHESAVLGAAVLGAKKSGGIPKLTLPTPEFFDSIKPCC